jgi:phage shock protein B
MHAALILSIIFGGTVLALAIIGSTILMAIKILKGGISSKGRKAETEEARLIQEIYEGLGRMESRVEALETLLLGRDGKDRTP